MYVFVYGTLQKGCGNDCHLRGATLIGPAHTVAPFEMINAGFPYIYPGADGGLVNGELWFIEPEDEPEIVARLDRLEGEGHHYNRVKGTVKLDGGPTPGRRVCGASFYQATPMTWEHARRRLKTIRPVDGRVTWPGRRAR